MNEQDLLLWLKANWPSVVIGFAIGSVYLRLSRFVDLMTSVEDIVFALREIHVKRHPEDLEELYKKENKK